MCNISAVYTSTKYKPGPDLLTELPKKTQWAATIIFARLFTQQYPYD